MPTADLYVRSKYTGHSRWSQSIRRLKLDAQSYGIFWAFQWSWETNLCSDRSSAHCQLFHPAQHISVTTDVLLNSTSGNSGNKQIHVCAATNRITNIMFGASLPTSLYVVVTSLWAVLLLGRVCLRWQEHHCLPPRHLSITVKQISPGKYMKIHIPHICHFFTLPHFEAWKFYTQKCVILRQKLPRDKTA